MQFLEVDAASVRRFAVGDALAILVFVMLGELSHGADPFAPVAVADAVLPFYLGWVVAAPLVGAYARDTRSSARVAVVTALLAWLGADLVAQVLRDTAIFGGNAAVTFFLVALAVGSILLAVWRTAAVTLFGD